MTDSPNVFISYAREDGTDYSARLRDDLLDRGIACWRDDRIDPATDFTGEIEQAMHDATHVAVVITDDLKRPDSFVRLEISYALTHKKPIIPLKFPGGHRPITIINHTYIDFSDWDRGFAALLERLKDSGSSEIDPQTREEREHAYLQQVGQQYRHWRDLYTDMSAVARIEERKVKLKGAAARYLQMRHNIHERISHDLDADRGKVVTTESFDELREGIREYERVALIGDPGAGKTTTLERLAYELAAEAVDDDGNVLTDKQLPLFVRLGAYDGSDVTRFLESFFGGLPLTDYLPRRVVFLLDGLNEMPPEHHDRIRHWLENNETITVIVSCRKMDYVELKLPLQRIDVAPLDLERIRLFMDNYFEADDRERLFWALAGHQARRAWRWYQTEKSDATYRDFWLEEDEPGRDWEPERKILDSLREQFRTRDDPARQLPDMLGVVTNPFLLQIVVEVYALSGEPPRNKGELFGRFVTLLFEERGRKAVRDDRPWIADHRQEQALAALAYRMQDEDTGTSVGKDFVLDTFHDAVPDTDPERLLYFAVSASILEQSGSVRFTHQLLQEYFAAYEMGEDMLRGVPATKYFPSDRWWQPTGWEETVLLLAGMEGNATPVVEWLTPIQPDLAYRVATESGADCADEALQALYRPAESPRRSPYALAAWGRQVADSDPRSGTGLREDGLPDIQWGKPVPAGTYTIGGDSDARSPLDKQQVTFEYSYRLASYPVTYEQFQAFAEADDYLANDWWRGLAADDDDKQVREQHNKYTNHPRENVNWYQAVAFTRWLTVKYREAGLLADDDEIRLPTEQEWEAAARYPDRRKLPWGDEYVPGRANVDEQEEGDGPYFLNQTTAVGLYEYGKQSELELYDLSGNVWEWCLNEYENPDNTQVGGTSRRVLRGGSFYFAVHYARAASRNPDPPSYLGGRYGFRLVSAPVGVLDSE